MAVADVMNQIVNIAGIEGDILNNRNEEKLNIVPTVIRLA